MEPRRQGDLLPHPRWPSHVGAGVGWRDTRGGTAEGHFPEDTDGHRLRQPVCRVGGRQAIPDGGAHAGRRRAALSCARELAGDTVNLSSGARLGPYEVLAPLGAGGMGEVYKARDTRLDRTVAIKVLPEHLADTPDLKSRFEREARAVSSLNHPHICTLYDIGSQDGIDYLVMEHIEGETLASRFANGPLPTAEVLRYAAEIADALDKAHRQGLVHRDLKPGNVMLTKSGAKLLDFGLARVTAASTPPGSSGNALPSSILLTQTP